jgi:RNA polymerase sigma factor (sigma-70 family)
MDAAAFAAWRHAHADTLRELYERGDAARWQVPEDAWAEALFQSATAQSAAAAPREVSAYLRSLHLAELALATACRLGHGPAWDHFVLEYRPSLHAAARAIAADEGRDLADALHAELFGLDERDGARRSLFAYYHGRSRLSTWLRSVLVQRQIDRKRRDHRLDQLDPGAHDAGAHALPHPERPTDAHQGDFERRHFVRVTQAALDAAIAALDARERLRLRLYYGENLTLAQIGRVTGESEATVSRKLERARRELRRLIEQSLRSEHGLSAAAIAECFEIAAAAPELQMTRLLSRAEDG